VVIAGGFSIRLRLQKRSSSLPTAAPAACNCCVPGLQDGKSWAEACVRLLPIRGILFAC
jgi:hypothetical protein